MMLLLASLSIINDLTNKSILGRVTNTVTLSCFLNFILTTCFLFSFRMRSFMWITFKNVCVCVPLPLEALMKLVQLQCIS